MFIISHLPSAWNLHSGLSIFLPGWLTNALRCLQPWSLTLMWEWLDDIQSNQEATKAEWRDWARAAIEKARGYTQICNGILNWKMVNTHNCNNFNMGESQHTSRLFPKICQHWGVLSTDSFCSRSPGSAHLVSNKAVIRRIISNASENLQTVEAKHEYFGPGDARMNRVITDETKQFSRLKKISRRRGTRVDKWKLLWLMETNILVHLGTFLSILRCIRKCMNKNRSSEARYQK